MLKDLIGKLLADRLTRSSTDITSKNSERVAIAAACAASVPAAGVVNPHVRNIFNGL